MTQEAPPPIFDTSLKALSFALNHSKDYYSQPLMSKAANSLTRSSSARLLRPGAINLSGLDGAGQAALILRQLERLDDIHILALTARAAKRSFPCSCRSPCCVGERPNKQWVNAVSEIAEKTGEFLTFAQTVCSTAKGKKRVHTNPQLRLKLVQKHFGIKYHLIDLGELFNLSESTVIQHRKPIQQFLTQVEKDGWACMDNALTEVGLVGSL